MALKLARSGRDVSFLLNEISLFWNLPSLWDVYIPRLIHFGMMDASTAFMATRFIQVIPIQSIMRSANLALRYLYIHVKSHWLRDHYCHDDIWSPNGCRRCCKGQLRGNAAFWLSKLDPPTPIVPRPFLHVISFLCADLVYCLGKAIRLGECRSQRGSCEVPCKASWPRSSTWWPTCWQHDSERWWACDAARLGRQSNGQGGKSNRRRTWLCRNDRLRLNK